MENPKKIDDRSIDISYRASNLGAYCGTVGFIKGNIGNIFKNKIKDLNLNIDISSDEKDAIPGDQWHEFMENSKFVCYSIWEQHIRSKWRFKKKLQTT